MRFQGVMVGVFLAGLVASAPFAFGEMLQGNIILVNDEDPKPFGEAEESEKWGGGP